jgi:agmatine deiminase
VNFYFANGAIIMPSFNQPVHDEAAYLTLRKIFPNKKIIMIPSLEILLGGGNIHCITQQIPLGGK